MDRADEPHSAQRLRLLLGNIVTKAAIEERWGIDQAPTDGHMLKLQQWYPDTQAILGRATPQRFPLELSVYLDEILAIAIGT